MADGVPPWLAISGVIVGVAVGSFDVVERVIGAFSKAQPEISQHYFVLEAQAEDVEDIAVASIENLRRLDPGNLVRAETIEPLLSEVLASPDAKRACENLENPVFEDKGCDGLDARIVFFSIRNDGPSPIDTIAIELQTFQFNDPEEAALLTIPTERQIVPDGEGYCLKNAFDDRSPRNCWATSEGTFEVNLGQPLLPDEYLHIPIHSYINAQYGTDWISSGATTGHLPVAITINDDFDIEARDVSESLVLKYERLSAGG